MNYEKLKNKYQIRARANGLIGICLVITGAVVTGVNMVTSVLLLAMGIVMIFALRKNYMRNMTEFAKVTDPDDFNISMSQNMLKLEEFSLFISDRYVVSEFKGLRIYPLKEMKKFEVGIAGDKKKVLFLTDRQGERHEIAETVKGDKRQKAFDMAYFKVKDIFDNKRNRK